MTATARLCLLVFSVAALGAVAWSFWPAPATTQPPVTPPQSETAILVPRLPAVPPPPEAATPAEDGAGGGVPELNLDWRDQATLDQLVEVARRHCPWPPHPSSWYTLHESCETALNRFFLTDDWGRVLDNPLATRHAVGAAFDNPECRPHAADPQKTSWREWPRWRGELRPELREACAADDMVRLADLQHKCIERLHTDWTKLADMRIDRVDRMAVEHSYTQEHYYRVVEDEHVNRVRVYWETHMCRSVDPAAFAWLDALPVPPGDPAAPRYNRPSITQWRLLYDAARRLGAEVPQFGDAGADLR